MKEAVQDEEPEEDKPSKTPEVSKIKTRSMTKAKEITPKDGKEVSWLELPSEEGTLDPELSEERNKKKLKVTQEQDQGLTDGEWKRWSLSTGSAEK